MWPEAPAAPYKLTGIAHRGIEPNFPLVREAPAASLEIPTTPTPLRPEASNEPVLEVAEIQGNIVAGFNKNFQTLLFLHIDDSALFKPWLAAFVPLVATADEVIAFNRLYKRTRDRRGYSSSVRARWINIAFSHAGLAKLTPDADAFADESFRSGVVAQSAALGDPTADDAEGNPKHWLVRDGDGDDAADVLIIVAADTLADLESEVALAEQLIFSPQRDGRPVRSGASIVFKQEGRTQLGALAGHEHFGFLDGISQPGLRGRVSDNKYDVLTLRQNPDNRHEGKPGQNLVWPGEFVFGYYGQDVRKDVHVPGADSLTDGVGNLVAPEWARNGSYLVFRRLRQDVFKFHSFLHEHAAPRNLTPAALGAKLVGRWMSGAPTMRVPLQDDPLLGSDDCANNHFAFQSAGIPTKRESPPGSDLCSDITHPQSPADARGLRCPLSSHIRKAHPRDDVRAAETETHRLLRRGIPFGVSSRSTPQAPADDGVDRGLLFMAYMTSITDQFEFVMKNWVNNPDFKERNVGIDPILGQSAGVDGDRRRTFNVRLGLDDHKLTAREEWVVPTGGGYFLAPSISAMERVLAR
jgi:Dyp-type peroxidase family